MSKKINNKKMGNKRMSIGNLIKRKPNWTATILVILILGIIYCYFGGDLLTYGGAAKDRDNLAEQAAQAVLYETGVDMKTIEEEMQKINQRIQKLSNSTDLGEYFAANDLIAEGRKTNIVIMDAIVVMITIFATYIILNVFRTAWLLAKGRKKEIHGKYQCEEITPDRSDVIIR